jgi:hypothetical protein
MKTIDATSSAFGSNKKQQPIVTTQPVNLVRSWTTCLKIIPLPVVTIVVHVGVIVEHVDTPSLIYDQ